MESASSSSDSRDSSSGEDNLSPSDSSDPSCSSSSSLDSENDITLDKQIDGLREELGSNAFDFRTNLELIKRLKKKGGSEKEVREIREKLSEAFALPASTWIDWVSDEEKNISGSEKDRTYVSSLYERAITDFLSVPLLLKWLDWEQEVLVDTEEGLSHSNCEIIRRKFDTAISQGGHHVRQGRILWQALLRFEMGQLEKVMEIGDPKVTQEQENRIRQIYKKQLSIPLEKMEETFEEYKLWEDARDGPKVTSEFLPNYEMVFEKLQKRMVHENKIYDSLDEYGNSDRSQFGRWSEYLEFEKSQGNVTQVQCLFERALSNYYFDPQLWLDYMDYMKAKYPQLPSRILKIVSRAVRNCPQAQFWKIYLISQEKNKTPMSQISQTFQKSIGTFMSEEEYKVLFDLYLDIRLRDFRKVLEGDDDQKKISSLQELRDVYQWAVQYLNHYNATHSIDIQGHWAKVEALYVRDAETSERLFEEVLKLQSKSSIYWEDAIESFIYLGKFDKVRNFLKRACNVVSATDFSFFARKWLGFERLYGSIESWEEALQRVKQKEEEYKETLQKLEEKSVSKKENKSQIQRISQKKGKRKLETDGDEEGRKFKKRKTEKLRLCFQGEHKKQRFNLQSRLP
eukprot:TRINITY_DN7391_c0_g1_i7.p1 TRINITY_DN7391_c0_g1~~TRINITY_DN7391_c0_g1_i7.p1  ORF type:complete len:650 (+),score=170.07 TRINITY_DN7391_c0_g1_i7:72-1952(+)